MTDAPKTIWAFYAPEIEEDNPKCTIVACEHVMHGAAQYTLASTVAAQLKAADELAEAITNEREMVCQDMGLQAQVSRRLEVAITAYRKAKDEAQ